MKPTFQIVLLFLLFELLVSVRYSPCTYNDKKENRKLFVATCDTRAGWKEFMALKLWNVTGSALREQGVPMTNVCKGGNWGSFGFLTKPLLYLQFIKKILAEAQDKELVNVVLMDSDTFWSVDDLSVIWNKFDCARNGKDVVLSTEMSCWVGRFCTKEDLARWYSTSGTDSPSYSPFANSGVVIGKASKVQAMLEHVIKNNHSYYIKFTNKLKFDDQYAIADYAISVAPQDVALDYHQQLLASFSINAPANPPEEGWPFVCKTRTGEISTSCSVWTKQLSRKGHFYVNDTSCLLRRKTWPDMPLEEELTSLAPDPIIWHGNGEGKGMFKEKGHASFLCHLNKKGMTMEDHQATYG